jgi:histidyl-tRNA synthetase
LIELLGGPSTPAVGFAAGLERIIMVMKSQGLEAPPLPAPAVFIAHLGEKARASAVRLLVDLRAVGIGAQIAMGGSLKAQLRQANRQGTCVALIVGEDELLRGEVALKNLMTGTQEAVALEAVVARVRHHLSPEC